MRNRIKIMFLAFVILTIITPPALAETQGISGGSVSSTTESLDAPETGNIRLLQTKYEPYPAEPGQIVTLWVAVQNWGEDSLDDVYLRVAPEYPFQLPRGDGIKAVGSIGAFGERLVEYDLIVNEDAVEGTYAFDVQQCSDSSCSEVVREIEVEISVKTGGSPRIKVGLEETVTFHGGKNGEVTLNIVNRGRLDTKFLTLTLLPSEDYEILSPPEVYMGELESDDFETADFDIFVNENIAESQTRHIGLPVKVEYTDSNNKDYTYQSQVKVKVYSEEDLERFGLKKNEGNSWLYVLAIIILLGVFYWFLKRKNKHQH